MNKYKIMEEIEKLNLKDLGELYHWLSDRYYQMEEDAFHKSLSKLTI